MKKWLLKRAKIMEIVILGKFLDIQIFLKPCISVVDILKMCIWVFGGARINFDRITAFRT